MMSAFPKSVARMGGLSLAFGALVQVVEPEEGNEDYQGRIGLLVTTLEADALGLKRYLVAFEGERSLMRFYASELAGQQHKTAEVRTEIKYLPASQSEIRAGVVAELKRITARLEAKLPSA